MPVSKEKFYMSGRDIRKHGQLNIARTEVDIQRTGSDWFLVVWLQWTRTDRPAMSGGFIQREMLQHVLPGLSVPRPASVLDEITGVLNAGNWHDEEIILNVANTGR